MPNDLQVVYRPRDFDSVIGQEHITESLKHLKKEGQWPHAYLMVGPSGVGKTTVARIIAKELGCDKANLMEIDAASQSSVEGVRTLTSSLGYEGFGETPTKVIILDECHSLSKAAWQALLKPIEEPPDHVYFMFCTTEPDKVPDTIKTRCHVYNFRSVPTDYLCDLLDFVCEEEDIRLPEKAITLIAKEAMGSPRRALTFLSKARGCESVDEVAEILEAPDEDKDVIELCRMLVGRQKVDWKRAVRLLRRLESQNPESVRIVVTNYVSKVLINTEATNDAMRFLAVLDAFSKPFNQSDKMGPLLLAIGSLIFEEE